MNRNASGEAVVTEGLPVVISRTFDASLEHLWRAWTEADIVEQWWGPHGFRTTARLDVRQGGRFALTLHAANGESFPLEGEYVAIEDHRSLLMEMHLDDHPASWHDYLALQFTKAGGDEDTLPSLTIMTHVTFQSMKDAQTLLRVEQIYASQAERDAFDAMGNADGWRQSFDKLDKFLSGTSNI